MIKKMVVLKVVIIQQIKFVKQIVKHITIPNLMHVYMRIVIKRNVNNNFNMKIIVNKIQNYIALIMVKFLIIYVLSIINMN